MKDTSAKTPKNNVTEYGPVIYVSSKQLPHNPDHSYIACRCHPEGNFDTPLYKVAQPVKLAPHAPKPNLRVKQIEWTKHPTAEMWRCDTVVGLYQVSAIVTPASWTFDGLPGVSAKGFSDGGTDAKAAAQTDYECRIMSALSP